MSSSELENKPELVLDSAPGKYDSRIRESCGRFVGDLTAGSLISTSEG